MAVSYDPNTNVTYEYLRYVAYPNFSDLPQIWPCIKEIAPSMMHPLLLPTSIPGVEISSNLLEYYNLSQRVQNIQVQFTRTTLGSEESVIPDPLKLPLPTIVGNLINISVFLTTFQKSTEAYAILPLMREAIGEVRKCDTESSHFKEISGQLEQKIKYAELQTRVWNPCLILSRRASTDCFLWYVNPSKFEISY
jgi:hypothetical protein